MRRFIAGLIGVVGISLATHVYAAGTATTKFEEIRLADNCGTWAATQGSQTVTTSIAEVDIVIVQPSTYGSTSVNWLAVGSGSTIVIQGWLSGTEAVKYVGTASGTWLAIDK